ncbi:hypothetical protein BCV53_04035 [Parageobacillus thermoglucosidasius]|uniref:Uncharacterized protein n=1 Tax=Parageobacillus thermoglucosidasius TaxID=1426 RepID=A0AAN0YMF6_PARTM|nr:hypothetical protein AOT13_04020 [Parageobacillus thermoglucosidasius]ANZ29344.1 hypothetical protein BCV53_04035 [Parageobacillus thermoglucosidasius]APM80082.1 hypothetical protein BCV54_04040 [Parageobacillus thermoglucosidasius]KJX69909.1 hypothetical protein WH82_03685 [Parageobacillus thermoglucosidasius]RDE20660.1 hypothetical protein DV712_10465 [Parageobacillus thermoglucosidasius]
MLQYRPKYAQASCKKSKGELFILPTHSQNSEGLSSASLERNLWFFETFGKEKRNQGRLVLIPSV